METTAVSPPSAEEAQDTPQEEPEYEVERINEMRLRRGREDGRQKIQFHVKWKGYPDSACTWEPFENLDGCSDLRDAFLASYRAKAADASTPAPSAREKSKKQKKPHHNIKKHKKQPPPTRIEVFDDEHEAENEDEDANEDETPLTHLDKSQSSTRLPASAQSHSNLSQHPSNRIPQNEDQSGQEEQEDVDVSGDAPEAQEDAELPHQPRKTASRNVDKEDMHRLSETYFSKLESEWQNERFIPEVPPAAPAVLIRPKKSYATSHLKNEIIAPKQPKYVSERDGLPTKRRKVGDSGSMAEVDLVEQLGKQAAKESMKTISDSLAKQKLSVEGSDTQLRRRWLALSLSRLERFAEPIGFVPISLEAEAMPADAGAVVVDNEADSSAHPDQLADLDTVQKCLNGDGIISSISIRLMPSLNHAGLSYLTRLAGANLISLRLHLSGISLHQKHLIDCLSGCTNLEVLEVSCSGRPVGIEFVRAIVDFCPNLRHLNLSGQSHIPDAAIRLIADTYSFLDCLILQSDMITDEPVLALARQCSFLRTLHLNSATQLSAKTIQDVISALPLLTDLSFRDVLHTWDLSRAAKLRQKLADVAESRNIQIRL